MLCIIQSSIFLGVDHSDDFIGKLFLLWNPINATWRSGRRHVASKGICFFLRSNLGLYSACTFGARVCISGTRMEDGPCNIVRLGNVYMSGVGASNQQ